MHFKATEQSDAINKAALFTELELYTIVLG